MSDCLLELDGVRVRYLGRAETALDVSLAVGAGEMVGVTGRTGAGKSTLAMVAAGFIPRVVRARVGGRVMAAGVEVLSGGVAATADRLAGAAGIVFSTPSNQLSGSKPTVREEIAFGLENLAVPRAEMDARIDRALAQLEIGHLADREPFALSGGEQQRVAIASILAMGPRVLVLDEPVAQLDPEGVSTVAGLLRGLTADGRAVLCAEHVETVLAAADRAVVLDRGVVVGEGIPGIALGSKVLGPTGLQVPEAVALAEMAGVPAAQAFDEEAIASSLARVRSAGLPVSTGREAPSPEGADPAPDRGDPVRIELDGVSFTYPNGVDALRGIQLVVEPGTAVAIVGQNGSGKTTLIKHLDGLLRPDRGTVLVGGRDTRDATTAQLARTVGLVFQDPDTQIFNRSVDREVAFGPLAQDVPPKLAAGRVEAALQATGLGDMRGSNPYDLALPLRKLVALASVLATDPPALVLDEPTTGQDAEGIRCVEKIVAGYRAGGRTVVAVTHDMSFAARAFDRIVVMRAGEIVADGSPADVFATDRWGLLASTGLEAPLASRVGARLGVGSTPTTASLVAALRS